MGFVRARCLCHRGEINNVLFYCWALRLRLTSSLANICWEGLVPPCPTFINVILTCIAVSAVHMAQASANGKSGILWGSGKVGGMQCGDYLAAPETH